MPATGKYQGASHERCVTYTLVRCGSVCIMRPPSQVRHQFSGQFDQHPYDPHTWLVTTEWKCLQ